LSGTYGARYKELYLWYWPSYVSEGPVLEDFTVYNFGTSDMAVPGNDRFRIHVNASAPAGLKEVLIMDGDNPVPWRRFLPGGTKTFEKSIDHFHDREYHFISVLEDTKGKKAVGWV